MTENSQNMGVGQSNTFSLSTNTSKKRTRNPFLEILRKSRTTFNKQIIRDAQMKKSAIEHVLKTSDKDGNMDDLVFRGNFYDMVTYRLLDSNRFVNDCKSLGIDPFNVAQHVIFDGNQKLDEVLNLGINSVYNNEILKMKEPIFTKEELEEGKINPKSSGSNGVSDTEKDAA